MPCCSNSNGNEKAQLLKTLARYLLQLCESSVTIVYMLQGVADFLDSTYFER
jgi:hypothetical protein